MYSPSEGGERGDFRQSSSRHRLLQSSVCGEVCEDLVSCCVSDMIRETVNSCVEDIIRRFGL